MHRSCRHEVWLMLNIQDTDPGFHSLIASLRSLEDKKLKVGVLPSAGRNSEGVDLVDVAVWNEFGTRHIPARPFSPAFSPTTSSSRQSRGSKSAAAKCWRKDGIGRLSRASKECSIAVSLCWRSTLRPSTHAARRTSRICSPSSVAWRSFLSSIGT